MTTPLTPAARVADYKPGYDTTIRTTTVVKKHNTMHLRRIDWAYPFDDPEHTAGVCGGDERRREDTERKKEWLRLIERCLSEGKKCYASNYGGPLRIWHEVLSVGMASAWPYWTPRPVVIVAGTLGAEWYDWNSLTGVREANT